MRPSPEQRDAIALAVRRELWRRGNLDWKLHADQLRVDRAIESRGASLEVLEIARRWGKSRYLLTRCARNSRRHPGKRVVYGAPTLKHLEEFILPAMNEVAADAPPDCRPTYNQASGHWTFPNGFYVHLFGADDVDAADRGRGPDAIEAIFDEAGFCPVLGYVLKSVFRPQLLHSGGKTLLGSTPSAEPEHEFTAIASIAEANGNYTRRTIHDNPLLSEAQIRRFIEDNARDEGMTVEEYVASPDFRREYLAERVTDKTLAVMGDDWEKVAATAVREVERPRFFDAYTVLDMGGVDPHAVLFGYWHFELAAFVVEDELLLRQGENTTLLADAIKARERALWGVDKFEGTLRGLAEVEQAQLPVWLRREMAQNAPGQPYLRLCDNDVQMAIDLQQLHGLSFIPTEKTEKNLAVNAFRVAVRSGKWAVHPRCRNLIRHLKQTTWQNARMKTYARTNAGEHGDLLDCGVYAERNLRKGRNPTPPNFGVDLANAWVPPAPPRDGAALAIFGRRRQG